jgi:hypothetical protein
MGNPSQTDNMGKRGSGRNQQQKEAPADMPREVRSTAERRSDSKPEATDRRLNGAERTNGGARGKRVRNH